MPTGGSCVARLAADHVRAVSGRSGCQTSGAVEPVAVAVGRVEHVGARASGLVGRRVRVGRQLDELAPGEADPQHEAARRRARPGGRLSSYCVGVRVTSVRNASSGSPVGVAAVLAVGELALELVQRRERVEPARSSPGGRRIEVVERGDRRRCSTAQAGDVAERVAARSSPCRSLIACERSGAAYRSQQLTGVQRRIRQRGRVETEQRARVDREETTPAPATAGSPIDIIGQDASISMPIRRRRSLVPAWSIS